jgi:hypothetical protein
VAELPAFMRGRDADESDATAFAGVEMPDDVEAAPHAACAPVDCLVAERVRKSLHRMTRSDRISVEVQLTMDLDESHRTPVAREHREAT